jgi:drug/metabolite transporter (DMT)-like permease
MILEKFDLVYLIILGTICTSLAYVAGVAVMKELSAFRVALITNLEPIYAIILAIFIFGNTEKMTYGFYLGAVVILGSIFLYPVIKNKIKNINPK